MRALDNNLLLEMAKPNTKPLILVTMELEGETVYMTDAFRNIDWNGNTYLATSGLIGISAIDESQDLIVSTLTVTLSGVGTQHIARLMSRNYLDRPLSVHFGALNDANELAGEPFIYFEGRMDEPSINDDPTNTTTASIKVTNVWGGFLSQDGTVF